VGRLFFERLGYVVTVLSCVQSLRALLQTSNTQRRAARPILIGVGGTLFMLLGLRLLYGDALFPVVYHTDISVIAFGILTLSRGIDRYRPFAIMPIGRKLAIEQLDDGLLVFDSYGCIVEANPAAVRILGWRADDLDRQVLKAIHPALGEALADAHSGPTDIVLGPLGRTYELRRSEIRQGDEAVGILLRLQDVTENRRLLGELRRLATEDGLTGTMNRRYFLELFQREAAASQATPMALLLFDVDHFKSVNDTYGHKVGDQVLVALVARVSGALRAGDLLGRYGGEEFIVLAHQVNPDAAARLAERLRHAIGSAPMATSVGDVLVTVSVGVAAWDGVGQLDIDAMIQEADCALYVAKEAGRNRVHAAWEHMPEIMRS
jgi:diguanylate cyclase (GGDEF)-like protein